MARLLRTLCDSIATIRLIYTYPDHIVEGISKITIEEVKLLGDSLEKLTACLSLVGALIKSIINCLSDEQMIEDVPASLLDLKLKELNKRAVVKIAIVLHLDEILNSDSVFSLFTKFLNLLTEVISE